MGESVIAYLSAGSNLGDRLGNLERGLRALLKAGLDVRQVSPVFETEPVGFRQQPWFLNIALEVWTRLSPKGLLAVCLEIESSLGRIRSVPGGPRTLDLDIILYGDLIVDKPELRIPHPRMAQRRFVLEPLARIAPGVTHPELGQTVAALLASCTDSSRVIFSSNLVWP